MMKSLLVYSRYISRGVHRISVNVCLKGKKMTQQFINDPIQMRRDTILQLIRDSGEKGLKKDQISTSLISLMRTKERRIKSDLDCTSDINPKKFGLSTKTISRDLNLFKDTGFIEENAKVYRTTDKGKKHSTAYLLGVANEEIEERFIYDTRSSNYEFNELQYEILDKVKTAIRRGVKLSFVYDKTSGQSERTVEPVGVVQYRGSFKLVALKSNTPGANKETLKDRLRAYLFPKMSEVNVLFESNIFSHYTNDEAVSWLNSGVSEYKVTEEYERVTLKLSKIAATEFSCSKLKGSVDWQFNWLNQRERKAVVSFSCQPSIAIVSNILSYGKYIAVEEGLVVKQLIKNNRISH
jgi:predicted DNA-binding transcriptional regulator YafY